jgi:WD40 repeat protein
MTKIKRITCFLLLLLLVTLPGCRSGLHLRSHAIPLLTGRKSPVLFIAVSPDEHFLMIGQRVEIPKSESNATIPVIHVYNLDPDSNRTKYSFEAGSQRFSGVFTNNGKTVIACDRKGIIRLRTKDGHIENILPKDRPRLISPQGDTVACVTQRGNWTVYAAKSQSILSRLPDNVDQVIAFSPTEKCAACSIKQTDPAVEGSRIVFLSYETENPVPGAELELNDHVSECGMFSPDGRKFAALNGSDTVDVWDVATGKPEHSITTDGMVQALVFAPDGDKLMIGIQGKSAKLCSWDLQTEKLTELFTDRFTEGITSICYAPNGETVYFGDTKGNVKQWNMGSRRPRRIR